MKNFLAKNYIVFSITAVVLVAGGVFWYVKSATPPVFGATTVGKGNVVESVDESGNVLTENSASLAFQEGGQIAHVYVKEGSVVSQGAVLADLDASQLQAAVAQANAAVAAAQAELDSLTSGTRPQQLQIDQSAVTSAQNSLGIAVQNAYSASDDAIENQTDNLFSNSKTNSPVFLVPNSDSQVQNNIQSERVAIGSALMNWYSALSATSTNPVDFSGTADKVLAQIESYLNTIALVVNNSAATASLPSATLTQYKGDVATARAEVEASISAVSGGESALTAAQNQLTLAQAGSTSQVIEAQQAVVQQAQAAAAGAQVALNHAALIAPFSGTVQNLTAQAGEVVTPGTPMLTLINSSGLKIETYASETDVAKLKTGDKANVTLDAYGTGTVFPATVTTIDAAETQVNGSAAYLVTLHFTNPDSRIKDGMTANVHIVVAEHDNVVEVPSNLVINDGDEYFVLVQGRNGMAGQQSVQVGLVGNNGMTEITSGLNVGDHVVNF